MIQEILKENEMPFKDNRSFDYKNINKAIKFGLTISLVDKGFVKTSKTGFKYNYSISFENIKVNYYRKGLSKLNADCVGSTLLFAISDFIKKAKISEKIINKGYCKCSKCCGKGKILAFMYYAEGICFDCMGLGFKVN